MVITVATSQFATTPDFRENARRMLAQMAEAAAAGADLIHFPEACLSGYAGSDVPNHDDADWAGLRTAALRLAEAAAELAIWVVFGSAHCFAEGERPHNSLFVVNPSGALVDRYDKRFCAGRLDPPSGDLAHYTPGDHFCQFDVGEARVGLLICHEYRHPELFREHLLKGTRLLLHSFHAGAIPPKRFAAMEAAVGTANHRINPATTIAGITQLAAAHGAASSNRLWISCSNSSAPRSCWGAFIIRPDGVCCGRLEAERDGLIVTQIDLSQSFYDSTASWRGRAISGLLYSGELTRHPASAERTRF